MELLTPWDLDGAFDAETSQWLGLGFVARVFLRYGGSYSDTTGQAARQAIPQPNLLVVEYRCPPENLSALENDAEFYILYEDGTESEVPSVAEFGQLRGYLAQQGVDQEDINTAIGTSPNDRTREEIVEELKVWLRTL